MKIYILLILKYIVIFTSHEERVFINSRAARDLLHHYCLSKYNTSHEEFKTMKSLLNIYQPALVPLLEMFENVGKYTQYIFNNKHKREGVNGMASICLLNFFSFHSVSFKIVKAF